MAEAAGEAVIALITIAGFALLFWNAAWEDRNRDR